MIGMHGTKTSNYGVSECDLLIAVGARFDDRVTSDTETFAPNAKILQIDIDPAEMNKNVLIDHGIVGDIKEVLQRLNAACLHSLIPNGWSRIPGVSEKVSASV